MKKHERSKNRKEESHKHHRKIKSDSLSISKSRSGSSHKEKTPAIEIEKEKPNFEPSGFLAKQTNLVNGVLTKFTEPIDASNPVEDWRLYTVKDEKNTGEIFYLNKKSCYLIGKDEKISDIFLIHPTISRQHAVIQFRKKMKKLRDGSVSSIVKPYLMDIESTNGTFLNYKKIDAARYYELLSEDVIKFGESSRDYVLMK